MRNVWVILRKELRSYFVSPIAYLLLTMFAAVSGYYFLYTIFSSNQIAMPFGLFWGVLIFNLDRYIVMSIRKGVGNFLQAMKIAVPRRRAVKQSDAAPNKMQRRGLELFFANRGMRVFSANFEEPGTTEAALKVLRGGVEREVRVVEGIG